MLQYYDQLFHSLGSAVYGQGGKRVCAKVPCKVSPTAVSIDGHIRQQIVPTTRVSRGAPTAC
jgi:hypothetical protein